MSSEFVAKQHWNRHFDHIVLCLSFQTLTIRVIGDVVYSSIQFQLFTSIGKVLPKSVSLSEATVAHLGHVTTCDFPQRCKCLLYPPRNIPAFYTVLNIAEKNYKVGSLALELLYCMHLVATASLALGSQTSAQLPWLQTSWKDSGWEVYFATSRLIVLEEASPDYQADFNHWTSDVWGSHLMCRKKVPWFIYHKHFKCSCTNQKCFKIIKVIQPLWLICSLVPRPPPFLCCLMFCSVCIWYNTRKRSSALYWTQTEEQNTGEA